MVKHIFTVSNWVAGAAGKVIVAVSVMWHIPNYKGIFANLGSLRGASLSFIICYTTFCVCRRFYYSFNQERPCARQMFSFSASSFTLL